MNIINSIFNFACYQVNLIRGVFNPIKRHQLLYRSKWGLLWYSCYITIFGVLIIWGICCIFNISADKLVSPTTTPIHNLPFAIISQFMDPGNLPAADGKSARIVAFFCALLGIVCLSGLVVGSSVGYISHRADDWKKGLIRYNGPFARLLFLRNYVVVIGINKQTATIIKSALKRKEIKYVLVQSCQNIEFARLNLFLSLDEEDENHVILYHGERTSEEDVSQLRLEDANEVFILGEDLSKLNEEDHDAYNMTCLEHVARYMDKLPTKKERRLRCHVNFEYQSTFMAFKFTHVYRSLNNKVEFLPFNIHELWSKKMLVDNYAIIPSGKQATKKVIRYEPIDAYYVKDEKSDDWVRHYINEDSTRVIHLVVAGMNQMGVALAMQVALMAHMPNFQKDPTKRQRTTITFIDTAATKEGDYLMGRYAALFELCRYRFINTIDHTFDKNDYLSAAHEDVYNIMWRRRNSSEDDARCDWVDPMNQERFAYMGENFMDLQWEFIEGNIACRDIREYLSTLANDTQHRTCTVAICFNNPQQSIATALYLPETVLKRVLQILVYQKNSFDLIDKIGNSEPEWKRYAKLKPFGMIEGCYRGQIWDNITAQFTNLVYADNIEPKDMQTTLTTAYEFRAKRLWKELGIVYKLANIDLVDSLDMKLRSLGEDDTQRREAIRDEEKLTNMAYAEHLRWLTERLLMGYRPLEEDEKDKLLESEVRNQYLHSKAYYREKSRAHLDICSCEILKKWDKVAAEKNNDKKYIQSIYTIRAWQQQTILREILSAKKNRSMVTSFVHDMTLINGDDNTVPDFWLGKTPVTTRQWKMIMGSLPKEYKSRPLKDEPITYVSWNDIQDFLTILRNETGLPFDLPNIEHLEIAKTKRQRNIKSLEGIVWQWTKSEGEEFASSKIFWGRSKQFKKNKWSDLYSYWLPSFKSEDLGFRLFLPIGYDMNKFKNQVSDSVEAVEDDKKVICKMIQQMVKIDGDGKGIRSFYIMQTPVLQRQWKAVMSYGKVIKNNPSEHRGDYYPVEMVSFKEAENFANTLNIQILPNEMKANGICFKIPCSDEWLYAAKQGCAKQSIIWHGSIARSTHAPLSKKLERNTIYDMIGNVWEWCSDYPENDKGHICRKMQGGSWRFKPEDCTLKESYWLENYRSDDLGFRLVISEEHYKKLQSIIIDNA